MVHVDFDEEIDGERFLIRREWVPSLPRAGDVLKLLDDDDEFRVQFVHWDLTVMDSSMAPTISVVCRREAK